MDKTLVITGISRGIGLETARIFLANGWHVIGTSTHGTTPLKNKNLKSYSLDLKNSQQINQFAEKTPKIDVLINNAAVLLEDWNQEKINMDQLKETFSVNVFGTIELTEKCIPKLNTDAQIINISSGWGTFSSNDSAYQPHYKMSKSCLNMYTVLLTKRLPKNIISSFDPGWVRSDMGKDNAPKSPSEAAQEIYNLVHKKKESGYFWHAGTIREW
ncbi:SDR family NAD(P)-dependent oxidoreductase [Legionella sainthelensi]|uniref:SDR family NAD(P)-dependent oxidoreductase n=1 Tax=Legionella sainthelensi TaxID=28087 RepID=UPI000E20946D|nr:SDR family NAD(P)-dependent oxidoreductase [Legionella sainthelensi]